MDTYRTFDELAENEQEGGDFLILGRETDSTIAVMAPHGGGIEPGTQEIAKAVAGEEFSFYALSGIKRAGNGILHLTSNCFDEPRGLAIARKAAVVVTIHGHRDAGEKVFIGGRNSELKEKIRKALLGSGFPAKICDIQGLRGLSVTNICNRGSSGEGVQLEISRGLRKKMFENFTRRSIRKKNHVFCSFVDTIRQVLLRAR